MVYVPSVSILASVALAAIMKPSLAGEAIVKHGLQSEAFSREHSSPEVCSSCDDGASVSLLQKQGRSVATQGSLAIHAGHDAPSFRKVLFIRTHFTGSSTLEMIMERYCEIHNKTCSPHMARNGSTGSVYKWKLLRYAEEHGHRDHVDVWKDHIEFDADVKAAFDVLMPGAVKMSLFREPMARLMSGFSHDFFPTGRVRRIIADLKSNVTVSRPGECRAMSRQVPSLSDIDVVGLTEDYERSLVLIGMKLGWEMEDLLYLHARVSPEPSLEHQKVLAELKALLQMPLSTFPEGSREFVKVCYLDDLETYHAANRTYHKQLASLTPDENAELEKRVARLHFAFETLTTCCEEAPTDPYCEVLMADSWMPGFPPQGWLDSQCRHKGLKAIRA